MSTLDDILDKVDDIDFGKVMASINIAKGLIQTGQEILELLQDKNKMSNIELLEIIERANVSQIESRRYAIEQIRLERQREIQAQNEE